MRAKKKVIAAKHPGDEEAHQRGHGLDARSGDGGHQHGERDAAELLQQLPGLPAPQGRDALQPPHEPVPIHQEEEEGDEHHHRLQHHRAGGGQRARHGLGGAGAPGGELLLGRLPDALTPRAEALQQALGGALEEARDVLQQPSQALALHHAVDEVHPFNRFRDDEGGEPGDGQQQDEDDAHADEGGREVGLAPEALRQPLVQLVEGPGEHRRQEECLREGADDQGQQPDGQQDESDEDAPRASFRSHGDRR
jgi:hypothetical protein